MKSEFPFFGGDGANLGEVRALPVKTFKALVDQCFNIAVPLNLTKAQFLALPDKERDKKKRAPYLIPATLTESPSRRLTANAASVALVFLDIDTVYNKERTEVIARPAAPYRQNPDTLYGQLEGLNFVLYETAQSTPENPRLRVMVEADGFAPEHYRRAVAYVAARIGLPFTTPESGVVVQAMFRPTIFAGMLPELEHPMLASRTDAAALRLADFADTPEGETAAKPTQAKTSGEDLTGDALQFLRAPVEEITLEHCREALGHLDPDLTYREWLEVAAALRHQFPRGDECEAAFQLFDEWSQKGVKYTTEDDTAAKWHSLRATPIGRVPVTIRSLLHKATLAGWDSSPVKDACHKGLRLWIENCGDLNTLLTQAVGKLAAAPLLTKLEESGLLNILVRVSKEKFDYPLSLPDVRKELKKERANAEAAKVKEREQEATRVPNWAKGFCYVAAPNEYFRPSTGEKLGVQAVNSKFGRFLLPSEEQLAASGQANSIAAQAKPIVDPALFLLNSVKIPTAHDYVYDPRQPNDVFISVEGRVCVNLFTRAHPEPDPTTAKAAGAVFTEHLQNLIGEEEFRRHVVDWLAYQVQFPGQKIRWAVLLQGAEGCGKTFLSDAMTAVLGMPHTRVVDPGAVFQNWNDWAFGSQLVTLEEIRVTGKNRHEVMNKLKPLITNRVISINERNRNQRQVENVSNYILFTNHHDALALSAGDRRFMVLKSPLQTKGQVKDLGGKSYFDRLYFMLENQAAGLRHFLETWQISPDFPVNGPAPMTPYHEQMQSETMNELESLIRELLEDGKDPLTGADLVSVGALCSRLSAESRHVQFTPQRVAATLREIGFVRQDRVMIEGERHVFWLHAEGGLEDLDFVSIAAARLKAHGAKEADKMFSKS